MASGVEDRLEDQEGRWTAGNVLMVSRVGARTMVATLTASKVAIARQRASVLLCLLPLVEFSRPHVLVMVPKYTPIFAQGVTIPTLCFRHSLV
jgi:hypothetical protein